MAAETVLVVDDNPMSLKLTRILLVNEGYKVVTAGSLVDAVELLRSLSPDLVLADLASPGMDGLELTRRLKQDEKTRALLVMAVAKPGDEQKAFDAGCDAYVAKPFDALAPRVRALLDGRATDGGA